MSNIFTFNFNDAQQVLSIGAALPAVCIVFVSLRFYTRLLQKTKLGLDDWLIFCGLICIIGLGISFIIGVKQQALGYPTPLPPADLPADQQLTWVSPEQVANSKIQFADQILLVICYGFIKLSIIAFYRRLFVTNKNTFFDILTKAANVVVFLWSIAYILIDIFDCGSHLDANWGTFEELLAYCTTIGFTSEYGFVISDFLLDVLVISLPLPLIWKLRMTTARKVAVTGIIMLGAAAIGASIARLVIYVEILQAGAAGVFLDSNLSVTSSLWWSMLEAGLALIAACLPTLSFLFRRISLQSVLKSVRSKLSIHSLLPTSYTGRSSQARKIDDPYSEINDDTSVASSAKPFGRGTDNSRTAIFSDSSSTRKDQYMMQDLESGRGEKRGL